MGTRRTRAQIDALLPDNTSQLISPEDVRDAVESNRVHLATAGPTINDDSAGTAGTIFDQGYLWLRHDTGEMWVLRDATATAAVWVAVGTGTGGGGTGGASAKSRFVGTVLRDLELASDGSLDLSGLSLVGYDHVEIRGYVRDSVAATNSTVYVRFNGDAGANYDSTSAAVKQDGTISDAGLDGLAQNEGIVGGIVAESNGDANSFSSFLMRIQGPGVAKDQSYTAHTQFDDGGTNVWSDTAAGKWVGNAAITSVEWVSGSGTAITFEVGSRLQVIGYREEPVGSNLAIEVVRSFSAYRSTAQAIVNDTATLIDLDTVEWNDGGFSLDASGEVVVSEAGRYRVTSYQSLEAVAGDGTAANEYVQFVIRTKDGVGGTNLDASADRVQAQDSTFWNLATPSGLFDVPASGTISLEMRHNLGADRDTGTGALAPRIRIEKVIPSVDATKFIDPVHAEVTQATGQSITNDVVTQVTLDTATRDPHGLLDGSNRIVIPRDGVYRIHFQARPDGVEPTIDDERWLAQLRLNPTGAATGGTVISIGEGVHAVTSGSNNAVPTAQVFFEGFLNADDEVEVNVFQSGSASITLNENFTRLSVTEAQAPAARMGMLGDTLILTSDQSTTDATAHTVNWDAYLQNDLGGVDLSGDPDRWVCPQAGWYSISFFALFAGNNTGRRILWIYKNGTSEIWFITENDANAATANADYLATGGDMYLEEGDTLDFVTYQSSGGNLDIKGGSGTPSQTVASIVSLSSIFGQYPEASDAEVEAGTSDQSRIITPAQFKLGVEAHGRERLTANTTFYIDADTGSNITGDGSSGNPWETPEHAWGYLMERVDCAGYIPTIRLQDATAGYSGFTARGMPPGAALAFLEGESEAGHNLNGTIRALDNSTLVVRDLTFEQISNGQVGFWADNAAIYVSGDITLTDDGMSRTTLNPFLASNQGVIAFQGDGSRTVSVDSVNPSMLGWARRGGHIQWDANWTIAHTGSPNYTTAGYFLQTNASASIDAVVTITGTNTGARWNVQHLSHLRYGDLTYCPGNAAGSTATGGRADAL